MASEQDHQLPRTPIAGMEPFPEFDPEYGLQEIEEWNRNQKPRPLTRQERAVQEYFDELKRNGGDPGRLSRPLNTQGGIFGARDPNEIPPSPPPEMCDGEASGEYSGGTSGTSVAARKSDTSSEQELVMKIPVKKRSPAGKKLTKSEADMLTGMLRPTPFAVDEKHPLVPPENRSPPQARSTWKSPWKRLFGSDPPAQALATSPANAKTVSRTSVSRRTRTVNTEQSSTSTDTTDNLLSFIRPPFTPGGHFLRYALWKSRNAIRQTFQGITKEIIKHNTENMSLAHRQAEFASKKPMMHPWANPIMYTSVDGGDDEDGIMIRKFCICVDEDLKT